MVLICVKAESGQYWECDQSDSPGKRLTVAKMFVLHDDTPADAEPV